MNIRPLP